MISLPRIVVATVFGLLLCCAISSAADGRRSGSDTWLEAQLVTSYTLNEHLNPFKIDVEVIDGVAGISGTVDSEIERDLAVEIAKSIDGIKEVKETLVIEPREEPRPGKSKFAQGFEDATLTAKVKYRLMFNKHLDSLDINVDTDDGVVTLSGTVDSGEKRDLALKLAENTSGVDQVVDRLAVAAGTEKKKELSSRVEKSMEDLSTKINDTWITAKARSVLLISSEAEGARFNISTEKGVVKVTGTVLSKKQAADIQQIIEDLQGVKGVENKLAVHETGESV